LASFYFARFLHKQKNIKKMMEGKMNNQTGKEAEKKEK